MKMTVRGWSRDMGQKQLADFNLSDIPIASNGTAYPDRPTMYSSWRGVTVAWCQPMRYMGDYRMDIEFSRQDVLKLFRAKFGSELPASLIEEHGFTLSPELVKSVLKTVKLADLTLGELASMAATATEEASAAEKPVEPTLRERLAAKRAEAAAAEKPVEPAKVRPLLRRV